MELPFDCRARVLEILLIRDNRVTISPPNTSSVRNASSSQGSSALAIRRVSRDLFFEASKIFFGKNIFQFDDLHSLMSIPESLLPSTRTYIRTLFLTDSFLDRTASTRPRYMRTNARTHILRVLALLPAIRSIEFGFAWGTRDPGIMQTVRDICDAVLTLEEITILRADAFNAVLILPWEEPAFIDDDVRLEAEINKALGERQAAARALMSLSRE